MDAKAEETEAQTGDEYCHVYRRHVGLDDTGKSLQARRDIPLPRLYRAGGSEAVRPKCDRCTAAIRMTSKEYSV